MPPCLRLPFVLFCFVLFLPRKDSCLRGVCRTEQASGWLSYVFLHFMQPLVSLGAKRTLTEDDVKEWPIHPNGLCFAAGRCRRVGAA